MGVVSMESFHARAWLVSELLLLLLASSVGFSLRPTPGSGPAQVMVSSQVGTDVQLSCACPALGHLAVPHVQWCLESTGPVLEQRGQQTWTAEDFGARAQVLESGPEKGDCSLLLRDLQVTDGGQYHGYLLQDPDQTRTGSQTKTETMTGIFICSVKLLVFSHSSVAFQHPGEDLLLDLHTPHAMTLVFLDSNSTEWRLLWRRGGSVSARVLKDPVKQQLSLRSVSVADEGLYKVLDEHGLTVSSTRLSLDQHEALGPSRRHKLLLRAGADRCISCALVLVASVLRVLLFAL